MVPLQYWPDGNIPNCILSSLKHCQWGFRYKTPLVLEDPVCCLLSYAAAFSEPPRGCGLQRPPGGVGAPVFPRPQLQCSHLPGEGGWSLGCFLVSAVLKTSGGGSSPRSILHSKANRYWIYCFFRELAALLEVPTFRLVASSRHFLFLLT